MCPNRGCNATRRPRSEERNVVAMDVAGRLLTSKMAEPPRTQENTKRTTGQLPPARKYAKYLRGGEHSSAVQSIGHHGKSTHGEAHARRQQKGVTSGSRLRTHSL
jgi:hypothetical protein